MPTRQSEEASQEVVVCDGRFLRFHEESQTSTKREI